ncbi:hypothetical protein DFW101_3147 [Solidesulfovibrio carbinoliphilus subsp. oakridgensis]|uniref:FMN-binding domain protein n=1 Tax=Solidesulfovibrio carbinoliphilus subsp. oakridgensis TaxID=694327 RepID=G7Q8R0_9BACT|nr:hypothetical protein [Solidesulfovibrio carbinoliphilus]EHJ49147.1 hypothetical protein DFW101_3147 [Solidesulfovibrio carbinoliphilus subsp. oakridgensis]
MPRSRVLAFLVLALLAAAPAWAESPSNLAGITLGDAAKAYKGRIRPAATPVDKAPWLRRQAVVPDKYFAGGYVLVGTCAAPGRVARIKVRYRDGSLDFFRKASGEMLSRYGDPTEYKGELDGRVMGNKWGFSDPWLRPVSLILQRVEGEDPETGAGNTVKLTNWGLIEAERICWEERHAPPAAKAPARETAKGAAPDQDNGYLPR